MIVETLSKLTKNIKLGTLTANLNFYKFAGISSLISEEATKNIRRFN